MNSAGILSEHVSDEREFTVLTRLQEIERLLSIRAAQIIPIIQLGQVLRLSQVRVTV